MKLNQGKKQLKWRTKSILEHKTFWTIWCKCMPGGKSSNKQTQKVKLRASCHDALMLQGIRTMVHFTYSESSIMHSIQDTVMGADLGIHFFFLFFTCFFFKNPETLEKKSFANFSFYIVIVNSWLFKSLFKFEVFVFGKWTLNKLFLRRDSF